MTPERLAALHSAGAVETSVAEFFGLSEAQERIVEFRAALAREARRLRTGRGLSQREMAKLMEVSQSRIPAIERGEASLDTVATAVILLGGTLAGKADGGRADGRIKGAGSSGATRPMRRTPLSTGPLVRPPLMARRKARKHRLAPAGD